MNMESFEDLENKIPGLPIPATPANISLARNFVLRKWKERAAERGRPEPKDLSDSCKFTSQFAMIVFGGYLQGNDKHQFIRLDNGQILDLNRDAADVRERIKNPHVHDEEFFGNPEHEESMASCRPTVVQWLREFSNIIQSRSTNESIDSDLVWNIARNVRNQIRVNDPRKLAGQCNWAAQEVAEILAGKGIQSDLVQGRFGDHIHAWVEVDGLIVDPTVEQFVPRKQYVSNPGDLPYHEVTRSRFGRAIESLDQRQEGAERQGQFVGVKFSPATVKNLIDWTSQYEMNSKQSPDKYHTSVIYSSERKFPYSPIRWNPPIIIKPQTYRLDLFGKNNDVLVLRFDSVDIEQRHWLARIDNKLSWDFPEFAPHVTLSDHDIPFVGDISKMSVPEFDLEIVSEYVKDWD